MKKIMFNDRYGLTQAVLEGRKTQTRRIIEAPKTWHGLDVYGFSINKDNLGNVMDITLIGANGESIEDTKGNLGMILPKYRIGETVAVAQSYKDCIDLILSKETFSEDRTALRKALEKSKGWASKMFVRADLMPHQIKITDIRVERLQDISDDDCLAEGIFNTRPTSAMFGWDWDIYYSTPREAFAALIDKVSGKGTWDSNPYVFVYEFELIR